MPVKLLKCRALKRNGIPCGHEWVARKNDVKRCPCCKSVKWRNGK